MSSRDYLYAQPIRIKSIEAIRIAIAQKLKAKWHSCKNIREFIALSKLRPRHALKLELFIDIHQKQKSNTTPEECIRDEATVCVSAKSACQSGLHDQVSLPLFHLKSMNWWLYLWNSAR